jgi:3-methyladenine DNA glycosylase AlkC
MGVWSEYKKLKVMVLSEGAWRQTTPWADALWGNDKAIKANKVSHKTLNLSNFVMDFSPHR